MKVIDNEKKYYEIPVKLIHDVSGLVEWLKLRNLRKFKLSHFYPSSSIIRNMNIFYVFTSLLR